MFIEANGLWQELFKFIEVKMDTSDLRKFVQSPPHSLDLFQNCASLSMMNSKSVTNWINRFRRLISENSSNTQSWPYCETNLYYSYCAFYNSVS